MEIKNYLSLEQITRDATRALEEDVGSGDITGLLIDEKQSAHAYIQTRESMTLCGIAWVNEVFRLVDPNIRIKWHLHDGDNVPANTKLCEIKGSARNILCAERAALNFLQTLSATSTQTRRYVEALSGTSTTLLDTRKTIPGLRCAQKYAVFCGGGKNHRIGLFDAFLIKENHIIASGSISEAIERARAFLPDRKLEIEVETLNEFQEALAAKPDVIMLDNFDTRKIERAIEMRNLAAAFNIALEISGNITLDNIRMYAKTGVDYISTGSITKNIQAIDLTLLFVP